jgi:hypothetical protein
VKDDPVLAQILIKKSECLMLEQVLPRGPEKEGLQLTFREIDLVIQHLETQVHTKHLAPKKRISRGRHK